MISLLLRDRDHTGQDINIFNPVYGDTTIAGLPNPVRCKLIEVETQETVGLYLQDQISLTDTVDIRIGARVDDYEQELINRRRAIGDPRRVSEYSHKPS